MSFGKMKEMAAQKAFELRCKRQFLAIRADKEIGDVKISKDTKESSIQMNKSMKSNLDRLLIRQKHAVLSAAALAPTITKMTDLSWPGSTANLDDLERMKMFVLEEDLTKTKESIRLCLNEFVTDMYAQYGILDIVQTCSSCHQIIVNISKNKLDMCYDCLLRQCQINKELSSKKRRKNPKEEE